jgi:hypothetical protein
MRTLLVLLALSLQGNPASASIWDWMSSLFSSKKVLIHIPVAKRTNKSNNISRDPRIDLRSMNKNMIVFFWYIHPVSIISQLKKLAALAPALQKYDIEVAPIFIDKSWGIIEALLTRTEIKTNQKLTWEKIVPGLNAYYDIEQRYPKELAIKSNPTVIFINRRGQILKRIDGNFDFSLPQILDIFDIPETPPS